MQKRKLAIALLLSLLFLLQGSIYIHANTPTLTVSNVLVDSGQLETLTAAVSGGTSPYTVNFYNVTSGAAVLAQTNGYQQWLSANAEQSFSGAAQSCITYSTSIYCIAGQGGGSFTSEVNYVPVLSTGIPGSWTSTNSYPLSLANLKCITNSNNIYCVGGNDDNNLLYAAVYYAPIFSSGVVGSWTATNSYPTNTHQQNCVTNSNNIYCIAGQNSIAYTTAVYYAPIFSSGSVGSWTSTNGYPIGTAQSSCALNSNNIYCIGGIYTDTVYYAPIFSSNVVGSWTATNTYPAPSYIVQTSCITNSNIIYCVGGSDASDSTEKAVYYAPIFSSGVVGSWTATTSHPIGVVEQSCVSNSNNIYCIAGVPTGFGFTDAVYYATLSGQGIANTLNYTFQTSSSTTNTFSFNVVVTDSAPTTANSIANTFSVNAILGVPAISTPTPSTQQTGNVLTFTANLPPQQQGTSPYVYNFTVQSTITGRIIANALYANSVAGNSFTWTIPSNEAGDVIRANVIIKDSATTKATVNSVYSGAIVLTSLQGGILVTNTTLDVGQRTLFFASTPASTGPYTYNYQIVNTITNAVIANALFSGCTLTTNSFFWTPVGGYNTIKANVIITSSLPSTINTIYTGTITVNAQPSITLTPSSPSLLSANTETYTITINQGVGIFNAELYNITGSVQQGSNVLINTIGGSNSVSFTVNSPINGNSFQFNAIVTDEGTTAPYTFNSITNTITVNSHGPPVVTISPSNATLTNGQVETYTATINGGTAPFTVNFFNVTGEETAQIFGYQQWLNTSDYPFNGDSQICVTNSNNIYCVAGGISGFGDTNAVYWAPILNSGLLGQWQSTNGYPTNVDSHSCVSYSKDIYCVGGEVAPNYEVPYNATYYAPILTSGTLGTWQTTNTYPANVEGSQCLINSNNIYCIGGDSYNTVPDSDYSLNAIYYAPILNSGTLGNWVTAANSYPDNNVDYSSCVTSSNNIYCMAGTGSSYYAPIFNSGTVGSWTQINDLNAGVGKCAASSNIIYCISIYDSSTFTNQTYYAPILNSGTIGPWTSSTYPPLQNLGYPYCVAYSNNIYCIGGYYYNDSTSVFYDYNTTYYAPLSSFGVANSLTYTFVANSPTTDNNLQFNVIVTDALDSVANSITNTIIVNYASSSSTTIQNGGGGIIPSGGGGAASGGGASPTVENYTANVTANNSIMGNGTTTQVQQVGYVLRNFSVDNCKTLNLKEKSINICVSYITTNSTSVIVNNMTYTLTQNTPIEIDPSNGWIYYINLLNITYLPIAHLVSLLIFAQSAPVKTNSSIASTSLTSTQSTSMLSSTITFSSVSSVLTTVPQIQQPANLHYIEILTLIIIILAVIVVIYYLSKKKKRRR